MRRVNSTVFNARFHDSSSYIHFSSSYSLSSKFLLRSLYYIPHYLFTSTRSKGSSLICIHYTHLKTIFYLFSLLLVPARIIILIFFPRNHYGFFVSHSLTFSIFFFCDCILLHLLYHFANLLPLNHLF